MSTQSESNAGPRHLPRRSMTVLAAAIAALVCVAFAVVLLASAHHGSTPASPAATGGAVRTTAVTARKSYGMVP
jgi:hypothetical protein